MELEKLLNNIKEQAQAYLLDAGEFFPFGVCIDKKNNIKPLSAYLDDNNDRPLSLDLIDILETHIEKELTNGNYLIAAICIDVSIKEKEEKHDALEVRIFEKNKTSKQHIKYFIKPHHVEFAK